jgi:hypothetical protein
LLTTKTGNSWQAGNTNMSLQLNPAGLLVSIGVSTVPTNQTLTVYNPYDNATIARFRASSGTQSGSSVVIENASTATNFNALIVQHGASYNDNNDFVIQNGSGHVGIGVAQPAYALDISGKIQTSDFGMFATGTSGFAIGAASAFNRIDSAGASGQLFRFLTAGGAYAGIRAGASSIGSTYPSTTAPTDGLIVQGRVGIGTATPNQPLEVVGISRLGNAASGFSVGPDTGFNRIDVGGPNSQIFRFLSLSNGFAGARMAQLSIGSSSGSTDAPTDGLLVQGLVNSIAGFQFNGTATNGDILISQGDGEFVSGHYSAGSNISLSQTNNVITIAATGLQPAFTTGAGITNKANVLSADLAAGSNITFTTNANGVISIASTGGGSVGGSGTTGTFPYWSGATTLADSPLTRLDANSIQVTRSYVTTSHILNVLDIDYPAQISFYDASTNLTSVFLLNTNKSTVTLGVLSPSPASPTESMAYSVTKTSAYNVVTSDSSDVFDNHGAGSVVAFTLPASSARGQFHTFYTDNINGTKVLPDTADQIQFGSTGITTASTGYILSIVPGSSCTIIYIGNHIWIATSIVGTWTVH